MWFQFQLCLYHKSNKLCGNFLLPRSINTFAFAFCALFTAINTWIWQHQSSSHHYYCIVIKSNGQLIKCISQPENYGLHLASIQFNSKRFTQIAEFEWYGNMCALHISISIRKRPFSNLTFICLSKQKFERNELYFRTQLECLFSFGLNWKQLLLFPLIFNNAPRKLHIALRFM